MVAKDLLKRAEDHAEVVLPPMSGRLAHVGGIAASADNVAKLLKNNQRNEVVIAAWLPDVGYGPRVRDSRLHPLGGAAFLRILGFPEHDVHTPPTRRYICLMLKKARTWWGRWWHRVAGSILFLLALGVTIFTASAASRTEPASGELSVSLVLLAGLFQLFSVALFSRSGRPDGVHAGASVRRLVNLTIRTQELSRAAQDAKGQDTAGMRFALTDLSARLNYIAQDTLASVEDWTSFNHSAERKADEIERRAAADETVMVKEGDGDESN